MSVRFWKNWLPLLLWMALIFIASTGAGGPRNTSRFLRPFLLWLDPGMTDHTFEFIHFCVRKSAHLTEYAVLGFLAMRVVRAEPLFADYGTTRQLGVALVFAALYASSDEFHQSFVPTRHPAVADVLIDTMGAAIGLAASAVSERARRNH